MEKIALPTYEVGEEEKNPVFLEKRVYQGSSGVVYPYPVIEKISDQKKEKIYKAVFIENRYIKVMILPELGGRIQMAYDKIRGSHIIYYNQVIKPALVGLTGPWISGGIEFNWPQHHRPSTFYPTEHMIEEHGDGSMTVWCNEVERMSRLKGMHGITLYPDKAYIEIKAKVYNRTPFPQTFLWWANPAVAVDDAYKSVFPPDVHAVFDHGKRDVSSFPIAIGTYYKQDYSAGVDISRYANIPVPTSYMSIESDYDFVGGYNEQTETGLLHVANHHISPGKKQWTWGNGDFGKAWERNLTDEDGPYIELMTGVYTDNQPDFSWLQPYEEKTWEQFFMPYATVGNVKNATKDLIANYDIEGELINLVVYATSEMPIVEISLKSSSGNILWSEEAALSPEVPFKRTVRLKSENREGLILLIAAEGGRELLRCCSPQHKESVVPAAAVAADDPKEITFNEQLYLTALHLEQYRHATFNPIDYYKEALSRDPGDVRCNNALGLLLMRQGQFKKAQSCFEKAIETVTIRNPNPYDGEPYYNLGNCLKFQSDLEGAYRAFFKATWNAAWKDPAYLSITQVDCSHGNWQTALIHVEQCLIRNWHNHKARHLKASLLRRIGNSGEALQWIAASLEIDRFNVGCLFEKYLLTNDGAVKRALLELLQGNPHSYLEYALDYASAGLFEEAIELLQWSLETGADVYPMIHYALGFFHSGNGKEDEAMSCYHRAFTLSPDRCFPNRLEEMLILRHALTVYPDDSKALYYLGNFWYAKRQYTDAMECWEKSVALDGRFPTVLRNLSLAYYNKVNRKNEALQLLEMAFSLDKTDSRILMELDQLYKKLNYPPAERLAFLDAHMELVEERDDLFVERIALYNQLGSYEKARELCASRKFHPWEGGEGKITFQYLYCRLQLAKRAIESQDFNRALQYLKETDEYPHNLGEGKLSTVNENDVDYYKGVCYRGLNDETNAMKWFTKATKGHNEPKQAFYYNDENPDKIYYQGLAWRALGNEVKAEERFLTLITHGEKHLNDDCKIDYFAVSLPDLAIWEEDLNKRNHIHCYNVMALGWSGLGEKDRAGHLIEKVFGLELNYQGTIGDILPVEKKNTVTR
jgi:tetratricopeptide (TPR) repeat protein